MKRDKRPDRAVAWRTHCREGQPRHGGPDDDDRRLPRARRKLCSTRRHCRGTAPGSGGGTVGQDQHERVGLHAVHAACSGWSSRGGQVRNPYVLDRSPLGSSSGSAVAVAANLCVAAIGAEVDGSIVRPASSNSIVGLKPTVGLVSRAGIIGVAPPKDTAGPMGRCVADVATILTVLAGYDPQDAATKESVGRKVQDYRSFLDPEP